LKKKKEKEISFKTLAHGAKRLIKKNKLLRECYKVINSDSPVGFAIAASRHPG